MINLGLAWFIIRFPLPLPFPRFPALRFPALRLRATTSKWCLMNTNCNTDRSIPSSLRTSSFSLTLVPLVISLVIMIYTSSFTEFIIFCWRIWEAFAIISSLRLDSLYMMPTQRHIKTLHEIYKIPCYKKLNAVVTWTT